MNKIAVVGRMHSGKTTLASMFIDEGYQRFAFADPVKDIAASMLTTFVQNAQFEEQFVHRQFDRAYINKEKGHPAIRKLLQLVGTELGREWLGPDTIWIDKFKEEIRLYEKNCAFMRVEPLPVINDDCRFPNEAQALRELGFTIVKLTRNEAQRLESVYRSLKKQHTDKSADELWTMVHEMQKHPSETEVEKIVPDVVVRNNYLSDLQAFAQEMMTTS